jgi:hypothetical protein
MMINLDDIENRDNQLIDKNDQLEITVNELKDLIIWMTGCGYDFAQHEYFRTRRDKLLK